MTANAHQDQPEQGVPDVGRGLSAVAIRRPVFTSMMMVGLVVLGIFSFRRLAIDQFPNVDIPIVTIQTTYPGASPETIEREVTRRLEEAFNPVQGVKRITSISLEGVSQIIIEFQLNRAVDVAAQDVRSKIDLIRRDLPEDIDPPVVQKLDPSAQPILSMALASSAMPLVDLTNLADQTIRRRLEAVPGVGEVRIAGGLAREVRVYLQPSRLEALGITVPEVMGALQRQNMEVPAGRVERGTTEQLVRVTGRITDPRQFGDVIVAMRHDQPVRVRDVARVEEGSAEERSLALVDGTRAVSLDILKVSGANTVQVADGVNAAITALRGTLPNGTSLRVVRDNSIQIRRSVHDVLKELAIGAFLTVVIVMLFLNDLKATAITSLALPVSVVSSFVLMRALDFTLNMLTLMALSLSIGILIDDAIVVIENIVRHREMGQDRWAAASQGTREIVLAVLATTLSTVAVFVPVAFMGGIIGRFFFQFGLTVAWAVLVSLFVSFTLTPMMGAWWGVAPHAEGGGNAFTRVIGKFNHWFDAQATRYRTVIQWALGHRKSTLAIAAVSFIGALMLFPFIGGGFVPDVDNSEFVVQLETPEGSSLSYTRAKAQQVIEAVRAMPGVAYTYTTIGAGATGTVRQGEMYVRLTPPAERTLSQQETMVAARERLARLYGVRTSVLLGGGLGGAQAPIQVEIRGPDAAELQRLAGIVMGTMRQIPGVVDIKSSLGDPRPELRVTVDREEASQVGVDIGSVASTIRPLLAGETATRWEDPTGEERDVVVQVEPAQRVSADDIGRVPVATSTRRDDIVQTVPLRDIARIERGTAPAQIDRKSLERVATIAAGNAPGLSISDASAQIRARLQSVAMPAGYSVRLGGETEQLEETAGYVIEAILLAIILIFLILASQFESVTQPFAIMLSLPLSLVGVLLALLITRNTLNIMSMIGVILLMGLVTKNAILLVDNANHRRRQGTARRQALVEAGAVRLRPIVMTTAAMIFGMLPIALSLGEGGGFRAPMARAVIGGLLTSTMLTLIVVPVAYTYFDDFGGWMSRLVGAGDRAARREEEKAAGGGAAPEPAYGD